MLCYITQAQGLHARVIYEVELIERDTRMTQGKGQGRCQ
jgi:hypothetical protein